MPYKLHPLSIPYRVVQSAGGIIPAILVLAFFTGQFSGYTAPVFAVLLIVGIGAIVGWQVAYYQRFEYELTDDTFDIGSGVISRRHREIPYRRIQNVDISRTLVQRALGIAELRIETAGGGSSEAHLRYVDYDEAKRLQDDLRRRKAGDAEPEEGAPTAPARDESIYEITERELGVLAVASFDLRVASFLTFILTLTAPSVFLDVLFAVPVEPFVVLVALALVVVILSAILSGASAIINNYGFKLDRVGDELRYERGLLQRYDGSVPLDKVQTLILQENVLKRLLGYASLTVETAGYAPGQEGNESARAVPIARRGRTYEIAGKIDPVVEERSFHRPAPQARIRYAFQYVIVVAVLTAVAFGAEWVFELGLPWWAVPGLVVLAPLAAHYKWKHRGYALAEEAIFTRAGFWRRRIHVVPFYRIQTVDESQTVLQRRWQIATVIIDTAGSSGIVSGEPTVYDLEGADATALREHLGDELQENLDEWRRRRQDDFGVTAVSG